MDLSKAYQSIHTGKKEADMRLFLWRENQELPWGVYCYDRVNFGDLIAALCLELAKRITAEKGREIDDAASSLILEAMFVDDFLGGGCPEDVERMRGSAVVDSNGETSYTGTMSKILSTTGFKTKAQVVTGSCSTEEAEALGEKALGLPYCPRSDVFMMRLQPSITIKRNRGTKVVTTLQQSDINRIRSG